MELTVKVTKILDPVSGVSSRSGEQWVKNAFVGSTQGEYPKTICFTVMGKDRWEKMAIKVGNSYSVSFDVESREWNGKYFTDLQAWKAMNLNGGQNGQTQQPVAQAPTAAPANGVSPFPTADAQPSDDSGLPF